MSDSVPTTGHARLDELLVALGDLDDAAIIDHPALFDAVHTALRAPLVQAAEPSHEPPTPA